MCAAPGRPVGSGRMSWTLPGAGLVRLGISEENSKRKINALYPSAEARVIECRVHSRAATRVSGPWIVPAGEATRKKRRLELCFAENRFPVSGCAARVEISVGVSEWEPSSWGRLQPPPAAPACSRRDARVNHGSMI